jgi:hypothetical protein
LEEERPSKQRYILRTKGLNAGFDHWPAIELATIELKPHHPVPGIALALNVPIEQPRVELFEEVIRREPGCEYKTSFISRWY